MIVPSNKLIWWSGAVLVPVSLAATFTAIPGGVPALIALAFLGLALLDACRSVFSLQPLSIRSAKAVPLVAGRPAGFRMVIANPSLRRKTLRLGVPLPQSWSADDIDTTFVLPEGSPAAEIDLNCTPGKRGLYPLTVAVLEQASPLGWWAVRRTLPLETEFQIYPDLRAERGRLAALFLRSGQLGLHAHRQVGKGREFEKLRDYLPGDSMDDIHWKATARRGKPITKVFRIERTQEIYMVIDHSRLMSRVAVEGETDRDRVTFLDQAITSSLLLAMTAEEHGDRFGVVTFSSQVTHFLRAGSGSRHFQHCRNSLYRLATEPLTPDYPELFTSLRLSLSRRALLVLFSSLDDPILAEAFLENVLVLSRKHLILVLMIQPAGIAPLFSGEPPTETAGVYDRLSGHLLWQRLRKMALELQQKGVRFELVPHEQLTAEAVSQYMRIKQKQTL